MTLIPQWEHDEQGDYREWYVNMDGSTYWARECRDGAISLHIGDYDTTITLQNGDYVLQLQSPDNIYNYTLVEVMDITSEEYYDWEALPAWQQALRIAIDAWSQCVTTTIYGHLIVKTA